LKTHGTSIIDLVHTRNLVYICPWYIFVGGFSWDFKPNYLIVILQSVSKETIVIAPSAVVMVMVYGFIWLSW